MTEQRKCIAYKWNCRPSSTANLELSVNVYTHAHIDFNSFVYDQRLCTYRDMDFSLITSELDTSSRARPHRTLQLRWCSVLYLEPLILFEGLFRKRNTTKNFTRLSRSILHRNPIRTESHINARVFLESIYLSLTVCRFEGWIYSENILFYIINLQNYAKTLHMKSEEN